MRRPKQLATGGLDGNLHIYDVTTNMQQWACKHDGGVVQLRWHPRLSFIYTASLDGSIRIWDSRQGTCVAVCCGFWSLHMVMCGSVCRAIMRRSSTLPSTSLTLAGWMID